MSLICFDNLKFFERKKLNVSFEIVIFVAPWSVPPDAGVPITPLPHHPQPPQLRSCSWYYLHFSAYMNYINIIFSQPFLN
jgi:hypothetical protein